MTLLTMGYEQMMIIRMV